jgi:hypothetical protein
MYDRARLTRLITCALASCAATWLLAATAPAHPTAMAGGRAAAPAFVAVPGDTNKAPSTAPAYQPRFGDHLAQANAEETGRLRAGSDPRRLQPAGTSGDDTATIALIAAIAAMVAALGALALAAARTDRPGLGA